MDENVATTSSFAIIKHPPQQQTHLNNTKQNPVLIKRGMNKTNIHINPGKRMANNIKHTIQRLFKRTSWIWTIDLHALRRELKHRKIIRRNSKTPHINTPSYQQ